MMYGLGVYALDSKILFGGERMCWRLGEGPERDVVDGSMSAPRWWRLYTARGEEEGEGEGEGLCWCLDYLDNSESGCVSEEQCWVDQVGLIKQGQKE